MSECRTVRHPFSPVPEQTKMPTPDPFRCRKKGTQSGTGLKDRIAECQCRRHRPRCRCSAVAVIPHIGHGLLSASSGLLQYFCISIPARRSIGKEYRRKAKTKSYAQINLYAPTLKHVQTHTSYCKIQLIQVRKVGYSLRVILRSLSL
jgi:hypothetical protein